MFSIYTFLWCYTPPFSAPHSPGIDESELKKKKVMRRQRIAISIPSPSSSKSWGDRNSKKASQPIPMIRTV